MANWSCRQYKSLVSLYQVGIFYPEVIQIKCNPTEAVSDPKKHGGQLSALAGVQESKM
jgi:hypothetical protein